MYIYLNTGMISINHHQWNRTNRGQTSFSLQSCAFAWCFKAPRHFCFGRELQHVQLDVSTWRSITCNLYINHTKYITVSWTFWYDLMVGPSWGRSGVISFNVGNQISTACGDGIWLQWKSQVAYRDKELIAVFVASVAPQFHSTLSEQFNKQWMDSHFCASGGLGSSFCRNVSDSKCQ